MLDKLDMQKDVWQIFLEIPKKKQVLLISAAMCSESYFIGRKFTQDLHEIHVGK